jgi:drug/metabolite transporter (DMT)-like permease
MTPFVRGSLYGMGAAALWGGLYVVSDVVLATIPPFTLLTIRLLIAVAVMGVVAWFSRQAWPTGRQAWTLLGVGALGFGVSVGAQFVGTFFSNGLNGSLITSAAPAFIVLFAVLLLGERLTWPRLLAVALAMIGVVIIIDPTRADLSADTLLGNVILGVAAVTWGLYSVLVRRVSAQTDTLMVSLYAMAGGLFITVPAAAYELTLTPIGEITPLTVLGVLYLSLLAMALATWLWNRAFALVDASVASLFFFAQPLVGAVLSVLILGQAMTTGLWIGGALILLGVLVALRG